jgi:small GTP-binding protein
MSDFTQTIEEIEKEIRETPYHKGTEHHIGKLRARLAKLKDKQVEGFIKAKGGGGGGGYAVKKHGDATVVLIGPPSAGKSTLINQITNAESKVAAYAFTTVSVVPGMLKYNDAYIQIFDLPGLIEGAGIGKGRGKEVLSVARTSDLLIIITDVDRPQVLSNIQTELEKTGIRINRTRPNIKFKKATEGGLEVKSNIKQDLSKDLVKDIASEFGIKNGELTLNQRVTVDDLIDTFSSNRAYIKALLVVNKIDKKHINTKDYPPNTSFISADKGIGLDDFKQALWNSLKLVKIYLVEPDEEPSTNHPIIMREGQTLEDVALTIGEEFASEKKLAKIWGKKAHYQGQEVPLTTTVEEGLMVRFL